MKTAEPILFDTNILVYNQDQDSVFYKQASFYHEQALEGKLHAVVAAQNLLEFTSIMLNPKRIVRPLTKEQVSKELQKYAQSGHFTVIYPHEDTQQLFGDFLAKKSLQHPLQVFDLFLVATMLTNGVKRIVTANVRDFPHDELDVTHL